MRQKVKPKRKAPTVAAEGASKFNLWKDCSTSKADPVPLSTRFSRGAFDFKRIQRRGDWCLYRKENLKAPAESISFEVIKPRLRKAREVFGKPIPSMEQYPSSEDWGKRGFTYNTLGDALESLFQKALEGGTDELGGVLIGNAGEVSHKAGKALCEV